MQTIHIMFLVVSSKCDKLLKFHVKTQFYLFVKIHTSLKYRIKKQQHLHARIVGLMINIYDMAEKL